MSIQPPGTSNVPVLAAEPIRWTAGADELEAAAEEAPELPASLEADSDDALVEASEDDSPPEELEEELEPQPASANGTTVSSKAVLVSNLRSNRLSPNPSL